MCRTARWDSAELCADQNEIDLAVLSAAVRTWRVKAQTGAVVRMDVSIPIIRFG